MNTNFWVGEHERLKVIAEEKLNAYKSRIIFWLIGSVAMTFTAFILHPIFVLCLFFCVYRFDANAKNYIDISDALQKSQDEVDRIRGQ